MVNVWIDASTPCLGDALISNIVETEFVQTTRNNYLSQNKRYEDSLRRMSSPFCASKSPKVQMNLVGLSHYAREKGVSVCDLTDAEKQQFGVFSME